MFSRSFVFIVNDTERSNNMIKPDYWSRLLCIEVGYSMTNTSSSRTREHPSPRNQPPASIKWSIKMMLKNVFQGFLPRHCRTESENQKVVWKSLQIVQQITKLDDTYLADVKTEERRSRLVVNLQYNLNTQLSMETLWSSRKLLVALVTTFNRSAMPYY